MLRYFRRIFTLYDGAQEPLQVEQDVTRNIYFRGSNLWILACAILIASIGLNVNSTAVIIGAMLISPLMGPIVGAGFALGIYDFELLKKSIRNLVLATVVSLITSTLYFLLSPFKDIQSELLARTAPTIYDVLIAFFGGIVGAIAITRVEKGNPIPGVAIATALMPPLCTAGYGLATGNLAYFLGAFYLYTINCTFIAISTFLVIKYLKYPSKKLVGDKHERVVRNAITVLILVMLIPSAYLAYNLYQEQAFRKATDSFVEKQFSDRGYTVVFKKSTYNASPKRLELAFLSHRFTQDEIDKLDKRLDTAIGDHAKLIIRQDSTDRLDMLKGDILNELSFRQQQLAKMEMQAKEEKQASAVEIFGEAKALFPDLVSLSIPKADFAFGKDSVQSRQLVIVESKTDLPPKEKERLSQWLRERLKVKEITLYKKADDER